MISSIEQRDIDPGLAKTLNAASCMQNRFAAVEQCD